MISQPTVVVIGAGVSHDLGLPLGSKLQQQVADLLSGEDEVFYRYFYSGAHNLFKNDEPRAQKALERAKQQVPSLRYAASVDNLPDQLKSEKDFSSICKMAIGCTIADAENRSVIARQGSAERIFAAATKADYFLIDLMNLVVRGHQEENIAESLSNLSFVVFNYDRCLERVLLSWLQMRFPDSAEALFKLVKILHVYGSLGAYDGRSGSEHFERGELEGPMQNPHLAMPEFAKRIKVFTEQEQSNAAREIEKSIHFARAVIFLGFGFEEQNMRFFFSPTSYEKSIFCTTMGKGNHNETAIKRSLQTSLRVTGEIAMLDGKAKQLFWTYYHSIGNAVGSLPPPNSSS